MIFQALRVEGLLFCCSHLQSGKLSSKKFNGGKEGLFDWKARILWLCGRYFPCSYGDCDGPEAYCRNIRLGTQHNPRRSGEARSQSARLWWRMSIGEELGWISWASLTSILIFPLPWNPNFLPLRLRAKTRWVLAKYQLVCRWSVKIPSRLVWLLTLGLT